METIGGGNLRRGLAMSIGEFGETAEPGLESGLLEWAELPSAHEHTARLKDALERCGYGTEHVQDRDVLTDNPGMGQLVLDRIRETDADGTLVVHVATHGIQGERSKSLLLVRPDGDYDVDTDVETWVRAIEDKPRNRPLTLFLVDACHAGIVARLPWQYANASSPRAFVLAATMPDDEAYDCTFTRAVAETLELIASDRAGLHPATEYVTWKFLVDSVRRIVVSELKGAGQHVMGTLVDTEQTPPFFRNPAYREPDATQEQLGELPGALAEFAGDELIDPGHFTDRAGGRVGSSGAGTGNFSGRTAELRALTEWLDRGPTVASDGVRVVTGAPGAGKSALLGVIACAGHASLRDITSHVWGHLDAPSRIPDMAAIHARRRTLHEIFSSAARQWGLESPTTEWTSVEFVHALSQMATPPVLVLDALDEAENALRIISGLLRPLLNGSRSDGRPLVRLLIGTRSGTGWPHIQELIDELVDGRHVIDLDKVEARVLREDIARFADLALRRSVLYDTATMAPIRRRVAVGLSNTLARVHAAQGGQAHGGAFLVATLFLNFLLRTQPPRTESEADALIRQLPESLPDVLEMDLANEDSDTEIRALMQALSIAEGDGIPLSILATAHAALAGRDGENRTSTMSGPRASLSHTRTLEALNRVRFYLRTTVDEDGTSLFRLFHQGLADYLAPEVTEAGHRELWALLVRRQSGRDRVAKWASAEPYLRRHAIVHARRAGRLHELLNDWEFVVVADPDRLLNSFQEVDSSADLSTRAVYRSSAVQGGVAEPLRRRTRLAVDAARLGDLESSALLLADEQYRIRWSTGGGLLSDRHVGELIGPKSSAKPMAGAVLEGRPTVITGEHDGHVRIWDVATREQVGQPLQGHIGQVWDVAVPHRTREDGADHVLEIVTVGDDGRSLFWSVEGGEVHCRTLRGAGEPMWSVAAIQDGDRTAVVAGTSTGQLLFGDDQHGLTVVRETAHSRGIVALTPFVLHGRACVVSSSYDHTIRVWDVVDMQELWQVKAVSKWVGATGVAEIRGVPHLILGSASGDVVVYDLVGRSVLPAVLRGHAGRVGALDAARTGSGLIVVSGGHDQTLRSWELAEWPSPGVGDQLRRATGGGTGGALLSPVGKVMRGHGDRVGAVVAFDAPLGVAVSRGRGGDDTIRVWDLRSYEEVEPSQGHTQGPVSITSWRDGDREIVASVGGDRFLRIWDADTGEILKSHEAGASSSVASASVSDIPVIVLASSSGVRVVNAFNGRELEYERSVDPHGNPTSGPVASELSTVSIKRTPCAVFRGRDGTLSILNLNLGTVRARGLTGGVAVPGTLSTFRSSAGGAFAAAQVADGSLRIWDLAGPSIRSTPRLPRAKARKKKSTRRVTATAFFEADSQIVLIVAFSDKELALFSAVTGEPWGGGVFATASSVVRIAIMGGQRPLAAFSTDEGSVELWDIARMRRIAAPIFLPEQANAIHFVNKKTLAVAFGVDIAVVDLEPIDE